MTEAQLAYVDVFLLLRKGDRLLFGLRGPVPFAPGEWNLVSGKVDAGEDAVTALIRESREEAGLSFEPKDLVPVGAVHCLNRMGVPRVGLAFAVDYDEARHGVVVNAEPHKCDELRWAPAHEPPQPLDPYNAKIVSLLLEPGKVIGLYGWE